MDRESRQRLQIQVQKLLKRVEPELRAIPGVKTLAVGLKVTNGKRSHDIVLRVGVEKKRPMSELSPQEKLPEQIDGIDVDVFEWGNVTMTSDTARYRPLVGGVQITNGTGGNGTLACLARRNVENDVVMLSNFHVMFSGKSDTATGIEIAQPGFSCCCCCRAGKIGEVVGGSLGGTIDACIATISDDIVPLQEVAELGGIRGTDAAVVDDVVRKRGRTSGVTTGVVSMVGIDARNDDGEILNDQIIIDPDEPGNEFQVEGDSGAALLDEDNNVIGLLWGRAGNAGVACQIANVESALNITIFAQPNTTTAPTPVVQMPPPGSDGVVRRRDWEALLWSETHSKDHLGAKVGQHWNEVWDLIQTNREVGLRWQRGQGPAFAAAFERTTRVTSYRVPEEIDGVTFTHLLLSMATALEQHGSAGLKADIRADAIGWIPVLQNCRTADELWLQYQNIRQSRMRETRDIG